MTISTTNEPLEPVAVPAFEDNYIWWLAGGDGRVTVVDPGEAGALLDRLRARSADLAAILVTHHHGDHTGGIEELAEAFPGCEVIAPRDPRIPGVTRPVGEGDRVDTAGRAWTVWAVPGHTRTHIAFLGGGLLLCGDTLFAGGCGRVFDGTFGQLAGSLRRIAALPGTTRVYCAHEYTLDNLGFAAWVEPGNPAIARRRTEVAALRARGLPSVPSTLATERATNPFLRTGEPAVVSAAEAWAGHPLGGADAVFRALREWKDRDYD